MHYRVAVARLRAVRVSGLIIALAQASLGAALLLGSSSLPLGKGGDPGPAVFPRLIGSLCLVSAVALLIRAVRLGPREIPEVQGRWRLALNSVGVAVAYTALVPVLGYFVVTPIMIAAMIWYLGVRSIRWAVGSAAGFTLMAWIAFSRLFEVPLPGGLLARLLG